MNAAEPIRRHARLAPDVEAYVRPDGRAVSYAFLDRMIDALAHRIVALGIAPRQMVVVGTNDPCACLAVALALARLGIVFAPAMHPDQPADMALVDRSPLGERSRRAATLMHCPTSTTTGAARFTPVSAVLGLRRLALRAFTLASIVGPRGGAANRQASLLPLGSWLGLSTALRVLWSGGTVLQPAADLAAFAPWIVRSRVTHLVASPFALQRVADAMPDLRGAIALDMIEAAGGTMPLQVVAVAQRRLCATSSSHTARRRAAQRPPRPWHGSQVHRAPSASCDFYEGCSPELIRRS